MTKISPQLDPNEMIRVAKTHGQDSIAVLLDKYRPWLIQLAENQIDSWLRPRLAASDVVQGSMLLAIRAFSEFRGNSEAELRSWLRTIFTNHLIDRQREVLAKKRSAERDVSIDTMQLTDGLTPSQILMAQEEGERLVEAIEQLDEELRVIVELRYLHALSFECIGEKLNLTRHAVSRRWVQAIEKLAKHLSESRHLHVRD